MKMRQQQVLLPFWVYCQNWGKNIDQCLSSLNLWLAYFDELQTKIGHGHYDGVCNDILICLKCTCICTVKLLCVKNTEQKCVIHMHVNNTFLFSILHAEEFYRTNTCTFEADENIIAYSIIMPMSYLSLKLIKICQS